MAWKATPDSRLEPNSNGEHVEMTTESAAQDPDVYVANYVDDKYQVHFEAHIDQLDNDADCNTSFPDGFALGVFSSSRNSSESGLRRPADNMPSINDVSKTNESRRPSHREVSRQSSARGVAQVPAYGWTNREYLQCATPGCIRNQEHFSGCAWNRCCKECFVSDGLSHAEWCHAAYAKWWRKHRYRRYTLRNGP